MSTPLAPIQEPVTGRDRLRDLRQPLETLAQFYKALNIRDMVLTEQNRDGSPEAAMDNPRGGIKRGWPEIRQTYERLVKTEGTVFLRMFGLHAARTGRRVLGWRT